MNSTFFPRITFRFSLVLILYLFPSNGFSQAFIDSARIKISLESNKRKQFELCLKYASEIDSLTLEESESLVLEALDIAKKLDKPELNIQAYEKLGWLSFHNNDWGLSIESYQNALELCQKFNKKEKELKLTNIIGALYQKSENYFIALGYYHAAQDLVQEGSKEQSKLLNNLALIYERMGKRDLAEENFEKSLRISQELGDTSAVGTKYFNMASTFMDRGEYQKAWSKLNSAKSLYILTNDTDGLGFTELAFGELFFNQNKLDSAITYYKRALQNLSEVENPTMDGFYLKMRSNQFIGKTLNEMNRFSEAIMYLKEAESIALDVKLEESLSNIYYELYVSYEGIGDTKRAIDFLRKYNELLVENHKDDLENSLLSAQLKYDFKLKDLNYKKELSERKLNLKIEETKRDKRLTVTILIISIFIGITLLTITIVVRRLKKIKRNKALLENELLSKNRSLVEKQLRLNQLKIAHDETRKKITRMTLTLPDEKQQEIRHLLKELSSLDTLGFWEEFEIYFSNVHNYFFENLSKKHGDLTANEKKLCAFIRMHLSSKEIASITYKSVVSVEQARSRLRKKLGLSKEESLDNYLSKY